jgi:hypothetical protein
MFARIGLSALVLFYAGFAAAEENSPADPSGSSSAAQVVYKGVVGNLLDNVPIEPESRATLQRVNALVSSPFGARSLALALGIASPPLIIIGVLWGLWSAANIEPERQVAERPAPPIAFNGETITTGQNTLALETRYVASSSLSTFTGGAAAAVSGVPCDNCVMPMLYPRDMPTPIR